MPNIVLASASPRRSEILDNLNIKYAKVVSNINEEVYKNENPIELVKTLAYEKANSVLELIPRDSIVIGADTIVVFNNLILGKPKDDNEAFTHLKMLSGKPHYVYSGISMIYNDNTYINYGSTKVFMKEYSEDEIKSYINTREPLDKAGAYGIQGIGSVFIEKIEGDFFTVMGLPVVKMIEGFRHLGFDYFNIINSK